MLSLSGRECVSYCNGFKYMLVCSSVCKVWSVSILPPFSGLFGLYVFMCPWRTNFQVAIYSFEVCTDGSLSSVNRYDCEAQRGSRLCPLPSHTLKTWPRTVQLYANIKPPLYLQDPEDKYASSVWAAFAFSFCIKVAAWVSKSYTISLLAFTVSSELLSLSYILADWCSFGHVSSPSESHSVLAGLEGCGRDWHGS